MALLDVNVLLALAWPNHPFHGRASKWFQGHAARGWATCLLTEAGFIRLSSNPSVVPDARRPQECAQLLARWKERGKHTFLADDALASRTWQRIFERCRGHQQVNDACLLAIAGAHRSRLVTFDARLQAIAERPGLVEVLS